MHTWRYKCISIGRSIRDVNICIYQLCIGLSYVFYLTLWSALIMYYVVQSTNLRPRFFSSSLCKGPTASRWRLLRGTTEPDVQLSIDRLKWLPMPDTKAGKLVTSNNASSRYQCYSMIQSTDWPKWSVPLSVGFGPWSLTKYWNTSPDINNLVITHYPDINNLVITH